VCVCQCVCEGGGVGWGGWERVEGWWTKHVSHQVSEDLVDARKRALVGYSTRVQRIDLDDILSHLITDILSHLISPNTNSKDLMRSPLQPKASPQHGQRLQGWGVATAPLLEWDVAKFCKEVQRFLECEQRLVETRCSSLLLDA
jgi:hypothetical protein